MTRDKIPVFDYRYINFQIMSEEIRAESNVNIYEDH